MTVTLSCLAVILIWGSGNLALAQDEEPKSLAKYEGVNACRPCHLSAKSGGQYKIWLRGPHASAYKTLATPEAAAVAKAAGVANAQKSPKCLRCHVTGYGAGDMTKGSRLTLEEGVSCEACHGAGSLYRGRGLMRDINEGKVDGRQYGLVMQTEEVCTQCHNKESPTYRDFNYAQMAPKIAHPVGLQSLK